MKTLREVRAVPIGLAMVVLAGCGQPHEGDEKMEVNTQFIEQSAPGPRTVATIPHGRLLPLLGDWSGASWDVGLRHGARRVLLGDAPTFPDYELTWRVLWDHAFLYFQVDVIDSLPSADSPFAWEDDSIEIYIDADGSRGTCYDGVNDYQLVLRKRATVFDFGVNSAPLRSYAVSNEPGYAGSFYVQVAIPWTELGVEPRVGQTIGIDVHGNDDDLGGERDRKVGTYATRDDAWTNPSSFGLLTLGPETALYDKIGAVSAVPVVDGIPEPPVWGAAPARPITRTLLGAPPEERDSAATFRAVWDPDALYVYVDVTDERSLRDSYYPWEDDSVEVYVDADHNAWSETYQPNDFQFVFRVFDPTVWFGTQSTRNIAGVRVGRAMRATGYGLELVLPWSTLGLAGAPYPSQVIGLDVHVNDDDDLGARDNKLAAFADVDLAWTDPGLFGSLQLAAP